MSHLLEFYGTECPHCDRMHELVEKLEKEQGLEVERIEIWHNKENEKRMIELDCDRCGGVPYFYNTKNDKWLCGEVSYKELKEWAK